MPQIQKQCRCGNNFWVYPYREKSSSYCSRKCTGRFMIHKKGFKCPAGSLAKLGERNPMYGKIFTVKHREKISKGISQFYIQHPEERMIRRNKVFGSKSPTWVGDKITKAGVHDWIVKIKGKASEHPCRLTDTTCKGIKNWSNRSQKYLRRIYDWQVLCQSHHIKYDMAMLPNWNENLKKTQFKKGQVPWNKKSILKNNIEWN